MPAPRAGSPVPALPGLGPLLATAVAAAGLLALVHGPAVGGYFIGDDFIHVGQVLAEPWNLLAADDPDAWFRPVTKLVFALDHLAWGLDPRGYHLTNIALHAANAALVAAVARRLLGLGWTGALAGLAFAVHPAHATTVGWISARADLLVTAFALLAVLAQARARRPGGAPARAALGAAVVLGCGSKETGVVVPALLLALDRLGVFGARGRAPAWRTSLVSSAGLVGLVGGYLVLRAWVVGEPLGGVRPERLVPTAWLPYEVALALARLLAPVHVDGVGFAWRLGLGALALALQGVALLGILREAGPRRRALRVGAAWLLVSVLPVASLLQFRHGWGGERYLYLPGVGAALVLAVLVARLVPPRPAGARLGAGAAVAGGVVAATLGLVAAGARRDVVAWGAVTGAAPAIQRQIREDPEVRPGDVALVLGAPDNPHAGPPFDLMLQTQLELALTPPYFPVALRANPYRLAERPDRMHLFLWRESGRRLERQGAPRPGPEPAELPAWDGLGGWTARDLGRRGEWWTAAGPRPALVSPPVSVRSLAVAGLEVAVRRLACPRWSACHVWRGLVESWRPAIWRVGWAAGVGDWEPGPSVPFRVAARPGTQRLAVDLLYEPRWVTAGSVGRLALLPPAESGAFQVEGARLVGRYGPLPARRAAGGGGPARAGSGLAGRVPW